MFGGLFSVSKSRVHRAAEHSVHPGKVRRGGASPIPCKERRGHGGGTLRGAFSGTFLGSSLVPANWRCLVPPASTPKGHTPYGKTTLRGRYTDAHRWAA
jgi:hypothetical protein